MSARSGRFLAAGIVLVLAGLITHGTHAGSGDEAHYQVIAHSLVFDRDLDLANDYGSIDPEAHARPGKDGRLRPVHDIGLPLLFAPYYAFAFGAADLAERYLPFRWLEIAKMDHGRIVRHFLSLAMIGLTAWIGLQLLAVFNAMTSGTSRAAWWAALFVLSPPLLSHSFLFFTEILSAAIAMWVFFRLRRPRLEQWEAALVGAATGYLMLVHARNAGLVAALVALGVFRLRRQPESRRPLVWFVTGAVAMLAVRALVTYHFWDTWITTPHARLGDALGAGPAVLETITRLFGWLVDQEHGLLPYAPIWLLLPFGWWVLWRRDRALCLELSAVAAACIAAMALPWINPHGWRGGWSPAARFLVPVMPFFGVMVFAGVSAWKRTPWAVRALVALQVGLDVILWQHPKLLWNDGDGSGAVAAYLDGGTGALSAHLPSFLTPVAPAMAVVLVAGGVLWVVLGARLARRVVDVA